MKIHVPRLALAALCALALGACGAADPAADCLERCAAGCCDAEGHCLTGQDTNACGYGGQLCAICPSGAACADGRCLAGGGCTALSCAGCCTLDGSCVLQIDETNCGARGSLCVSCSGSKKCVVGRCSASACVQENCPLGCCSGDFCVEPVAQTSLQCGRNAQHCQACAQGEDCSEGGCVAQKGCDATCEGCCSTTGECVEPLQQSPESCGKKGEACRSCEGAAVCVDGSCVAEPSWDVTAERALVADKDGEGGAWDGVVGDPKPDPYICVGVIGSDSKKCTAAKANTVEPAWYEFLGTFTHGELTGPGLYFDVRDEDGAFGYPYESIGRCILYPAQALQSGKVLLEGESCSGGLYELYIELVPRAR